MKFNKAPDSYLIVIRSTFILQAYAILTSKGLSVRLGGGRGNKTFHSPLLRSFLLDKPLIKVEMKSLPILRLILYSEIVDSILEHFKVENAK